MSWTRREALLGLGGIPILGAVWWAGAASTVSKKRERDALLETLNIQPSLPPAVPGIGGEPVRVGVIGFGIRGEQLCRALGYATEEWIAQAEEATDLAKKEGRPYTALEDFRNQDKLNVRIVGICDIYDYRAEKAMKSFSTPEQQVKRYKTYQDMIGSGEVEAQCKTLVQQRCKQAGMRWGRIGLESLLRVRCAVRDGRYDRQFGRWRGNLTAWHMAAKRRRTAAA